MLQIEEAWHNHVSALSRDKSPMVAVHSYFLFDRLFSTLRLQFSNLTREACNYIGNGFKSIASHFLVTAEFLMSDFEIPKVFIDSEMVSIYFVLYIIMHTHPHTDNTVGAA